METIRKLPAPVRFGAPAALLLIIGLVLWMTVLTPSTDPVVFATPSADEHNDIQNKLEDAGIKVSETRNEFNDEWELRVQKDMKVTAESVIESSGLKHRLKKFTQPSCGAEPGMMASAQKGRNFERCKQAASMQESLMASSALRQAKVTIGERDAGFAEDAQRNVLAEVFLEEDREFNASGAAAALAAGVSTDVANVVIMNADTNDTLYHGEEGDTRGATGGCAKPSQDDIVERQAEVSACIEQRITAKLESMFGPDKPFVVAAAPRINSRATSSTSAKTLPGAQTNGATTRDGNRSTADRSWDLSENMSQAESPAGNILTLAITIAIHPSATFKQANTVLAIAKGETSAFKGSPIPRVMRTEMDESATENSGTPTTETAPGTQGGDATTRDTTSGGTTSDAASEDAQTGQRAAAGMPVALWVLGGLLVVGLVAAIVILWRRATRMAAERERMTAEFSHEQQLLTDFAQQNPDDIARDLERMFGAPSAPASADYPAGAR